jgi:hypothetical protein
MLNLREQDRAIEENRIRLNALVAAKAFNMRDPEVIALSDRLDQMIVEFERTKALLNKGRK